jgi:hypothetical protein
MPWTRPLLLRDYLDRPGGAQGVPAEVPPETPGIYVLTQNPWVKEPDTSVGPLYVGASGNRTPQARSGLRGRIGDLISSMCGFHGNYAGRHAGGICVSKEYCVGNPRHSPIGLWIAWRPMPGATPKAVANEERQWINRLKPLCNKR